MGEHITSTLQDIRERNAFHLADRDLADCLSPDSRESAGAAFLTSVRDAFMEAVEQEIKGQSAAWIAGDNMDMSDRWHAIADDAPDYRTHVKWCEFVDLGGYQEDLTELGEVNGDDLTMSVADVALHMIAERLCMALWSEIVDAASEDADAEDADEDDDDES